jgi:Fe-S-cluster containining protein
MEGESALKLVAAEGEDRQAYFTAQIPCPLLNLERQDCIVYEIRPAVCRYYMVVSDPVLCAPENHEPNVQVVDTSELQAVSMKVCMELANGAFIVAPISLMVLFSLPKAARSPEDETYLRELTVGLPDPVEWMKQTDERHARWSQEDTDESKVAFKKAFSRVFSL